MTITSFEEFTELARRGTFVQRHAVLHELENGQ